MYTNHSLRELLWQKEWLSFVKLKKKQPCLSLKQGFGPK